MKVESIKYFFCHVSNDWQIGIIKSDLKSFLFANKKKKVNWIKSDFNVYKADPFGVEKEGKLYLFYEEYIKSLEYAVLRCGIFDENLKFIVDQIILDDGTHKSFPFVFQHLGKYYLMPESGYIDKLIVYEATEFPFKWKEKMILLNFPVSDAVIKYLGNKWYLFYSKSKAVNENKVLYLRVSNQLFDDWQNLEERIVKNDLYDSRNAGDIVNLGGSYYRFAQNCEKQYGENVVVNEILDFDISSYTERFVLEKRLLSANNGFHTLNATSNFVLLDRRINRLKLKSLATIFRQIFKLLSKRKGLKG